MDDYKEINIDILSIKKRVYQYTSRKARLLVQSIKLEDAEEEYTLGAEDIIRENLAVPFNCMGIQKGETDSNGIKYKTITLSYDRNELRTSIVATLNSKLGVSIPQLATKHSTQIYISLIREDVENVTAMRAKAISTLKKDVDFDSLTLTQHEDRLFMSALMDARASLEQLGFKMQHNHTGLTFDFDSEFIVESRFINQIQSYLRYYILAEFYKTNNLPDVAKEYTAELVGLSTLFKQSLSFDTLLDGYIKESATDVYTSLYVLCKGLPFQTYTVGNLISFILEERLLPINGSVAINLFNHSLSALKSGVLAKYYAQYNMPEDYKLSSSEASSHLTIVKTFSEKRAKYVDIFSDILREVSVSIKKKILGWNKGSETLSYMYDEPRGKITFSFAQKDLGINALDIIQDDAENALVHGALLSWYIMCDIKSEIESNGILFEKHLNSLHNMICVKNKPTRRPNSLF